MLLIVLQKSGIQCICIYDLVRHSFFTCRSTYFGKNSFFLVKSEEHNDFFLYCILCEFLQGEERVIICFISSYTCCFYFSLCLGHNEKCSSSKSVKIYFGEMVHFVTHRVLSTRDNRSSLHDP